MQRRYGRVVDRGGLENRYTEMYRGFESLCLRGEQLNRVAFYMLKRLGEMPEWSIGAVSKTVERFAFQGFESLSLRSFF